MTTPLLSAIITFNHPFDWSILWSIAIVVVLLVCSALMSGSETALFSLSPTQLEQLRKHPSTTSKAILHLLSQQDSLLATILIMNNLVNIFIISIANNIIDSLVAFNSEGWEFFIKTIAVTFLLLLFGEIMPKVYANYNPLRLARIVAQPLRFFNRLLRPLSYVLVRYSEGIQNRVSHENISMEEIEDALEITENPSATEKEMLSGIVQFSTLEVEEIMHPRMEIEAIDINEDFDHVRRVIIESGYSRIPVYDQSIDHIVGMLYVKDMLPYVSKGADFEWNKHLRAAYYTTPHKKIGMLLEEFQTQKVHIAIVVDEYGSTQGLISLEDILEEIVGEITDESDTPEEAPYKCIAQGVYLFEGKAHIGQLEEVLELAEGTFDDCRGEAETVAGMLLEVKRDFLKRGDKMTLHDVQFKVTNVEGRRVEEIRIELLPK